MGNAFFKALRWFIFTCFFIGGIWAMINVQDSGPEYWILAVFSFGGAYLSAGAWRELPRAAMVFSVLMIGVLAFAAQYVPWDAPYRYFGVRQYVNFYMAWMGLSLFIGVPFMMIVYYRSGA